MIYQLSLERTKRDGRMAGVKFPELFFREVYLTESLRRFFGNSPRAKGMKVKNINVNGKSAKVNINIASFSRFASPSLFIRDESLAGIFFFDAL